MKKFFIAGFIMFAIISSAFSADMADFISKANTADKNLKIKEMQYSSIKKQNNFIMQKINTLKAGENNGMWLQKFFRNLQLGYYLRQGNNCAYKMNALDKEIKELKEVYFTYSSLIIEEYDKKILECIKSKCEELKNIYAAREKWMANIRNYGDILWIDISVPDTAHYQDKQAAEDIKAYLNKKLIQIEERIYILQDEKNIGKAVKAAGIKIKQNEMDEMTAGIKELEKTRTVIEKKLRVKIK